MGMHDPVNFDSVLLDGLLADWLQGLQAQAVEAVAVLAPDALAVPDAPVRRMVAAVHPARLLPAAQALADSSDFGEAWTRSASPLVAWQDIAAEATAETARWRRLWLAAGLRSAVRVEFPLPAGRAFECFLFTPRALHDRGEAALIAWSAFNVWPLVRQAIAQARSPLSARETECLQLAFGGLTAADTARRLACSERTVAYHLANAMRKLGVDSKIAAVQRACWLGAI